MKKRNLLEKQIRYDKSNETYHVCYRFTLRDRKRGLKQARIQIAHAYRDEPLLVHKINNPSNRVPGYPIGVDANESTVIIFISSDVLAVYPNYVQARDTEQLIRKHISKYERVIARILASKFSVTCRHDTAFTFSIISAIINFTLLLWLLIR